jgi:hypothetical protein
MRERIDAGKKSELNKDFEKITEPKDMVSRAMPRRDMCCMNSLVSRIF